MKTFYAFNRADKHTFEICGGDGVYSCELVQLDRKGTWISGGKIVGAGTVKTSAKTPKGIFRNFLRNIIKEDIEFFALGEEVKSKRR